MRCARRSARRGTVLPLIGVCLIGLFAFVALAIDLGMLAVSRTQSQNAADVAALVGTRTLNNKPGVVNSNLVQAVANAKIVAKANPHLSKNFTDAQITKIEVGQYLYDASANPPTFRVVTWNDVTNAQTVTPSSGSWTAIKVTLTVSEPTYFMKVMGVNSMPSGAVAVAVYRPRDVAFVLDMTGSMGYSSTFNTGNVKNNAYDNQSLNPDDLHPVFGHYGSVTSKIRADANQANSGGEAFPRNNVCIATPAGPPLIRGFYFSTTNVTSPTTVASPIPTTAGTDPVTGEAINIPDLKNAFHRWSPPESGGDSTTYTPPIYDFTGYNAFHTGVETDPKGPTPAPDSFKTMTDSGEGSSAVTYVGDRWRRANGSINKTDDTWATSATTTKAAGTALELLGYNASGTGTNRTVRGGATDGSGTSITTENRFRDLVWEQNGYDLDIATYRTDKGTGAPLTPSPASTTAAGFPASQQVSTGTYTVPLVAEADRFKGYSMGPGYWGKTFFIWPPDPRWGGGTGTPNPASPQTTGAYAGVKDTNGNWICDWRRRFFLNSSGSAWTAGSTSNVAGIDASLLTVPDSDDPPPPRTLPTSGGYTINYPAVLKWIKSGPQVLPPNLRAGRVVYYTSIPDDVNTGTGTTEQRLDKIFWRNYIDYVIGRSYDSAAVLYGHGDSWAASPVRVYSGANLTTWNGGANWPNVTPYMNYSDSPYRPRLHFWFGPLSMVDFVCNSYEKGRGGSHNWTPGTTYEAQNWQLKAGMSAVIDDVRNNHPNDFVGMVMFSADAYNGPRVPMGQDYKRLKNALFYPKSLLTTIGTGDVTTEIRPYNTSFNMVIDDDEIPNANGSTDPCTGLAYAFNLLSPSSSLSSTTYGTTKGRRGAAKLVIFETDGVPNTHRNLTFNEQGYNSYYSVGESSGNVGNGNSTSQTRAYGVIEQMAKPMATTTSGTSGFGLPNAPARVYPLAFGDLFDEDISPTATYRPTAIAFLNQCAAKGNTTTLTTDQIITGPYSQRIDRLRKTLQTIFQSGVSVTLIQ